jgi:hypothetical protein
MSLGPILVIILVIFLLGGFSGRFRGYGYGYGHRGVGLIGIILIILLVLVLLGRIWSEPDGSNEPLTASERCLLPAFVSDLASCSAERFHGWLLAIAALLRKDEEYRHALWTVRYVGKRPRFDSPFARRRLPSWTHYFSALKEWAARRWSPVSLSQIA